MKHQCTVVIEERGRWYVAYLKEIRGANTQGRTLTEAQRNLHEALRLILEIRPMACHSERRPDQVWTKRRIPA